MYLTKAIRFPETYLTLLFLGSVLFSFLLRFDLALFTSVGDNLFGLVSKSNIYSVFVIGFLFLLRAGMKRDRKGIGRLLLYGIFLSIGIFSSTYLLHWVFTSVDVPQIITKTIGLVELDKSIFGEYLYFLPVSPWLEYALIGAYWFLNWLVVTVILLCAWLNREMLRKFIFSFLLLSVVSVPFWYLFPATSPAGFFRENIFDIRPPAPIQEALAKKHLTPYMQSEMDRIKNVWIVPVNGYYNVSTIPSLHAGYGVLVLVFLAFLRKYSLFVTIPWFLLNVIGAVYIEQHFGLDIVVGIGLAVAVYFFTEWLFKRCAVK